MEIDEDYFVDRHRYDADGLEYLRYMLYHPRTPDEDEKLNNIWAKGHTVSDQPHQVISSLISDQDYNTLTFLFHQPVAGLQVQTRDGWKYVRSNPDAIIVNVADALEFLSGGYLKSTVHRVIRAPSDQASRPRLGLIYFARPEAKITLAPVQSPLLARLGLQKGGEESLGNVTAEGTSPFPNREYGSDARFVEWARARIAKDHRFRTGIVKQRETEIIAGVSQKYYD